MNVPDKEPIWVPGLFDDREGMTPQVLSGVEFEDAVIIGPAVLLLAGGAYTLTDCTFDLAGYDPASAFFELPFDGQLVLGCIGLRDVSFTRCEFRNIGWMGSPATIRQFREALFGPGWDERS